MQSLLIDIRKTKSGIRGMGPIGLIQDWVDGDGSLTGIRDDWERIFVVLIIYHISPLNAYT